MTIFSKENNTEFKAAEKESEKSLGLRISEFRKKNALTQEEFAEKLGVTAQAVSKWENDISCPDIMLLPEIAKIFKVSIDELMGIKTPSSSNFTEQYFKQTDLSKLKLRIHIVNNNNQNNKPINISVPVTFVLKAANIGIKVSAIMGNETLSQVPFDEIVELIKNGVTGEVFDMTSDDGTNINIEIS